ncbi:SMI1/KNR4 family protein [Streptacidiphilus sp. ASG 303]|uniref:SMI1/KNR4 family protein n=1 Tax=Streptacidiphilus sp. ASG 303 TaxID=2896847 RepID=UPI001E43766C|nr:SMI1/KNR4 family protein [Streptacidiphilus sp. ASG 303]MCD0486081.1 SMI1/KNR4 family protein [Streptacidiphilus sp. ASG 303]
MSDPLESVAELERVVPGLATHCRPVPAVLDWSELETDLGAALPADFKLLSELYPAFELGGFLLVGLPGPGTERGWPEGGRDLLETAAEWCEDAELTVPLHPWPAPGGLYPWGTSNEGDFFLWATSPAGPWAWTVTVASRNGCWWHYTGGAVQFLADLVGGALEPWGLPPVRPIVSWVGGSGGGGR